MHNLIGLLTILVFCLATTGNLLAQREVPPPATTPLDPKPTVSRPVQAATVPVTSESKPAPKGVQAAKAPEKATKTAKPAPVQASMVPAATDAKKAPKSGQAAKAQPEKAARTAKQAVTNGGAAKPKAKKIPKICKTGAGQEPGKVAPAKKEPSQTARKTTKKTVLPAATIPVQ
jgi:hypothetical protein